jgi:hypothetical protein
MLTRARMRPLQSAADHVRLTNKRAVTHALLRAAPRKLKSDAIQVDVSWRLEEGSPGE